MILKVEGQWMDTVGPTYDYFESVVNPRVWISNYRDAEKYIRTAEGATHWYLRNEKKDGEHMSEIVVTSACPHSHYAFDENTATAVISWASDGMHYVICNTKAYLMNDLGKTIERVI